MSDQPSAAPRLDLSEALNLGGSAQERSLMMAARCGDSEAFRELYEAYHDRIWTLVVYSVGDLHQAQDVFQTVFFKAFRGLRSFKFQSSLFTWLYRIALNECRNYHGRREAPHLPLEAIVGSSDEIDRRPMSSGLRVRKAILQNAVMQPPPLMREVIVLKYKDGLSYDEISRVLGCAPGTVGSRLNRALSELEERLRPFRSIL
jgi:RNA polymerase sigma-70 factor (ECF subfamily)